MRRMFHTPPATPGQPRRRVLGWVFTGTAHVAILGVLLWLRGGPQPDAGKPTQPALQVSLLPSPKPPGLRDVAEDAAASRAQTIALPTPPAVPAPSITIAAAADNSDLMSDSQLAGAARAGEGGGGGGSACDMARAVQQALRRDPLVRPALADANRLGRASLLWNGDWIRSGGQDGKGLAAVRQAVLWEVGFAPQACRNETMHGLVVLSLTDGNTRFAIGTGAWRWSDLLGLRTNAAVR